MEDNFMNKLMERGKIFSRDNFKAETESLRKWYDLVVITAMTIGASISLEDEILKIKKIR